MTPRAVGNTFSFIVPTTSPSSHVAVSFVHSIDEKWMGVRIFLCLLLSSTQQNGTGKSHTDRSLNTHQSITHHRHHQNYARSKWKKIRPRKEEMKKTHERRKKRNNDRPRCYQVAAAIANQPKLRSTTCCMIYEVHVLSKSTKKKPSNVKSKRVGYSAKKGRLQHHVRMRTSFKANFGVQRSTALTWCM